jgi:uncharacterized protein
VKKAVKLDGFHPTLLFAHFRFPTDELSKSIRRLADWIVANGIDGPGSYRAARDLLIRNPPRFTAGVLVQREMESWRSSLASIQRS